MNYDIEKIKNLKKINPVSLKILALDDEDLFLLKLVDILDNIGFDGELIEANTSTEMLEKYKDMLPNKPDLVLVDLNLKTSPINGIEVIKTVVNDLGNDVLIGMLTSTTDKEERRKCKEAGGSFFISKNGPEVVDRLLKLRKHFFEDKRTDYLELI